MDDKGRGTNRRCLALLPLLAFPSLDNPLSGKPTPENCKQSSKMGQISPQSIPAEKLVSNGLVVLQSVAGAGHVNDLAAVDEAVKDSGGNGGVAEEVGPLVKTLVGSNNQ